MTGVPTDPTGADWQRYGAPIKLDNPTDSRAIILGMAGDDLDVLELGCSAGFMSRVLAERGCRVVGVDIDPVAAEIARPHLDRLIIGDLDTDPLLDELEPGSFDLVLVADVLEHLRDPAECLRSLIPLLRPGGSVIISVPNVAYIDVRLALLEGRFEYRDYGLLDRTHLHMFTLATLLNLLTESGLTPVEWHPNRLEMGTTEIEFDPKLTRFGRDILKSDLQAEIYQWIVRCRPSAPDITTVGPDIPWGVVPQMVSSTLEATDRVAIDDVPTSKLAAILAQRVAGGIPRRIGRALRRRTS